MDQPKTKEEAIREFFRMLEAGGYERPPKWSVGDAETQRNAVGLAIALWAGVTSDLSVPAFEIAALTWLKRDKYSKWPKPGHITTTAEDLAERLSIDGDTAWGLFKKLVSRHGAQAIPKADAASLEEARRRWLAAGNTVSNYSDPPPFLVHEDPEVAAGMMAGIDALGGWRSVSYLTTDGEVANRASFRAAFKAARSRSGAHKLIGASHLPQIEQREPDNEAGIRRFDELLLKDWHNQ